jgi:hypothetical protein
MKIRFLTSIASATWAFHAGDTLEVATVTPEIAAWLTGQQGRGPIAEVLKADESETTVIATDAETAVLPNVPRRRTRSESRAAGRDPRSSASPADRV